MKEIKKRGGQVSINGTGIVRLDDYGIEVNGVNPIQQLLEELGFGGEEAYQSLEFCGMVSLVIEQLDEPLTVCNHLTQEKSVERGKQSHKP